MKGNSVKPGQISLKNRLQKNQKKLKAYLQENSLTAYRLYNKDIPEYPYLIDIYQGRAVVFEQGRKLSDENQTKRKEHQDDIEKCLTEILHIPPQNQYFKIRERQKGTGQYQALDPESRDFFIISEPPFKFLVNLERYLDTGLFLDHRPLRQHIFKESQGKKVLNLFCYTGSISTAAAMGGGEVTSIDMSKTYLQWARENFLLNDLDPKHHRFLQSDVLKELFILKENKEVFDIIVLDPPSFSNSKRMEEDLDIERDHPVLIRNAMNLLAPRGILYFSTNKRKFELHSVVTQHYIVREISHWTIPRDFNQSFIHRAFSLEKKTRNENV